MNATTLLAPELFQELAEIEDDAQRARKEIELEQRAKELKMATPFRKLLNESNKIIKADKRRRDRERRQEQGRENETDKPSYQSEFTGAPIFNTGKWQATDEGVFSLGERGVTYACRHPLYIKKLMRNAETDEYSTEIAFKRWKSGAWETKTVSKETLAKASKITRLAAYGIDVTDNTAKALVDYMSTLQVLNPSTIVEKVSSSHLGWVGSSREKMIFMPYEADVDFDAGVAFKPLYEAVAEPGGSSEEWYELIRKLRKTRRMEVLMCIAASLASVMVELCGALPFVVDFWGGSGKGKTVALMLAASVWANPNEGAYISSARSTTTAEEIRLGVLNSLPMMIDDISQIKQAVPDIGLLVYQWCSGMSKSRSNQDLGLNKIYSWRNCIITNAEQSLVTDTMQGGAINRIIDVEIGDTPIFENGQKVADCVRANYGWLGRDFINVLREVGFDEVRQIVDGYKEVLHEMAAAKGQTKEEKQVIPMALILAADDIAEERIFKDGVHLSAVQCLDMLKDINQTSENVRAYNMLRDIIASRADKFPPSISGENLPDYDDYDGSWRLGVWGLTNTDGSVDIIGREFERLLKEEGFQGKEFLSWAARNGVIQAEKSNQPKIQRKVNGKNVRCVRLLMKDELLM